MQPGCAGQLHCRHSAFYSLLPWDAPRRHPGLFRDHPCLVLLVGVGAGKNGGLCEKLRPSRLRLVGHRAGAEIYAKALIDAVSSRKNILVNGGTVQ